MDLVSAHNLACTCSASRRLWLEQPGCDGAEPARHAWKDKHIHKATSALWCRGSYELIQLRLKDGTELQHFWVLLFLNSRALEYVTRQDKDLLGRTGTALKDRLETATLVQSEEQQHIPFLFTCVVTHYRPDPLSEACMEGLEALVQNLPPSVSGYGAHAVYVEGKCWVRLPSGQLAPLLWEIGSYCRLFDQQNQLGSPLLLL